MHPSRGSGGQRQGEVRQTNTFEPPTPRVERAVAVHRLVECSARMWGGEGGDFGSGVAERVFHLHAQFRIFYQGANEANDGERRWKLSELPSPSPPTFYYYYYVPGRK
jgi:hypothetical protein